MYCILYIMCFILYNMYKVFTYLTVHFAQELVTLQFEGGHLDRKDTFGKSDPYYEIYRITGGTEALVKRSEVGTGGGGGVQHKY